MGKVKIRSSDKLFSDCIRERAEWTCERCGAYKPEGQRMGLHCSHFHGRGKWSTRFDPDNCESLCYGCHSYLGAHPYEHEKRKRECLGDFIFELLLERAHDTRLGRDAKKNEAEIRAHYRIELNRMEILRAAGERGRLELMNWC